MLLCTRVTSMRVLGVVLSAYLTMGNHLDEILSSSASSIHALRMLRFHGLHGESPTTCNCPLYHPGIYVICPPGGASPPPWTRTGWRSWLVGCGVEVFSRMMFCLSLTWLRRLIGGYLGPSSPTRVMCWVDISQLLRPPAIIFAPVPMVSPSQKRILVVLSLGCSLKGFIDFLVCGLLGFLTYLRFVYIFPNSLYSKF